MEENEGVKGTAIDIPKKRIADNNNYDDQRLFQMYENSTSITSPFSLRKNTRTQQLFLKNLGRKFKKNENPITSVVYLFLLIFSLLYFQIIIKIKTNI